MMPEAKELESLRHSCICFCLAELDEPLFILRAQDTLAPRVVVRWAQWLSRPEVQKIKCKGL